MAISINNADAVRVALQTTSFFPLECCDVSALRFIILLRATRHLNRLRISLRAIATTTNEPQQGDRATGHIIHIQRMYSTPHRPRRLEPFSLCRERSVYIHVMPVHWRPSPSDRHFAGVCLVRPWCVCFCFVVKVHTRVRRLPCALRVWHFQADAQILCNRAAVYWTIECVRERSESTTQFGAMSPHLPNHELHELLVVRASTIYAKTRVALLVCILEPVTQTYAYICICISIYNCT